MLLGTHQGVGKLWLVGLQPFLEQECVGHRQLLQPYPQSCVYIPFLRTGALWIAECVSGSPAMCFSSSYSKVFWGSWGSFLSL